ncbi:MAG: antibiotic biosynthesis monooxygenase [Ilumatobacteraceae bacterium]|nr:antibiotic biosynthesis monooxygenase [Ilumatobacteraceae bacterium]
MSTIAVVTFRCNPDGRVALIDFLSGEEGLSVTRAYDGAIGVQTLLSNDSDDVVLYEEWESVEHHQAYVGWRVETGLADFLSSNGIELEIAYLTPTDI